MRRAPFPVALDALWQKAPAERLGVGDEVGVEPVLGLGLGGVPASRLDDIEQVAGVARQPVPPHSLCRACRVDMMRAPSREHPREAPVAFEQGAARIELAPRNTEQRVFLAPRALECPPAPMSSGTGALPVGPFRRGPFHFKSQIESVTSLR